MFPDVTVEAMKHYRVFQNIYIKNDFEFMLFVVSHNGQSHPETASCICRKIEAKRMLIDGRVSKFKSLSNCTTSHQARLPRSVEARSTYVVSTFT